MDGVLFVGGHAPVREVRPGGGQIGSSQPGERQLGQVCRVVRQLRQG